MIPIYDVNRSIPGHYIWNKGYGVLRRRMHLHSNVQVNAMLQHIVSVTNNACVESSVSGKVNYSREYFGQLKTAQ